MSTTNQNSPRSSLRRVFCFVLVAGGLCLVPFVVLAGVVLSYLGLNGDAAALRQQVFAATPSGWHTKVQLNVGEATLGAAGFGMSFVQHDNIDRARDALAAVKRASVGIYERKSELTKWSRGEFFAQTDQAMRERGWLRLVGVADEKSTVLVYGPQENEPGESMDICVAVVADKHLIVVSAKLDAPALEELIRKNHWDKLPGDRHFLAKN